MDASLHTYTRTMPFFFSNNQYPWLQRQRKQRVAAREFQEIHALKCIVYLPLCCTTYHVIVWQFTQLIRILVFSRARAYSGGFSRWHHLCGQEGQYDKLSLRFWRRSFYGKKDEKIVPKRRERLNQGSILTILDFFYVLSRSIHPSAVNALKILRWTMISEA